jgi:glutathione peroxidase-family protein
MARFHEYEMASLAGEQVAFSDFADSACLVVNVASA